MQIDFITLIILILALYGLVAIIRDIGFIISDLLKKRAANEAYREAIKDFQDAFDSMPEYDFSKIAIGEKAFTTSCDTRVGGCTKTKRKYNKSGKYKEVSWAATPGYKAKTTNKKIK